MPFGCLLGDFGMPYRLKCTYFVKHILNKFENYLFLIYNVSPINDCGKK